MANEARVVASTHHTALKTFALESSYGGGSATGGGADREGGNVDQMAGTDTTADADPDADAAGRGEADPHRTVAFSAAMEFLNGAPTYRIRYGTIGDAHAFETAARLGASDDVLA